MSREAAVWAEAQAADCPKGASAHILQLVADWADERCLAWASVVNLAERANVSDRQVQRCLRQLVAAGLLVETGKRTKQYGQFYPIYRLPIERGYPTIAARRAVERAARKALRGGDMGVTPSEPGGDMGVTPGGDMGVTPGGDMGVTPIDELNKTHKNTQGGCVRASADFEDFEVETDEAADPAFETVARAWVRTAPERFIRPRSVAAWRKLTETVDRHALQRAALAYLAAPRGEVSRGRCKSLHRWLEEGAFEVWLPGALFELAGVVEHRFADAALRDAAVELCGEDWVKAYLDPADWDAPTRTIRPRTGVGRQRLMERADLWRALKASLGDVARREGEVSKLYSASGA